MPLDETLLPPRLPIGATQEETIAFFAATFGVRVDLSDLPAGERASLAGARVPRPDEARLLDRVLQMLPGPIAGAAARILVIDSGVVGREGSYRAGIVRLYTPVLRLTLPDPIFGGRFSYFTTTVLHELAHAAYATKLTPVQRNAIVDAYLDELVLCRQDASADPTELGAEHLFARVFTRRALRLARGPMLGDHESALWEILEALGF
jgi:hypothetical protein